MRLLRVLGVLLSLLLVAVLAAAWLVPPLLDLNGARGRLATLAGDRLGGSVRIDGPIALRLLPEPILTAAGVSLASPNAGAGITVAEMRLRVALGPLLAGRIEARELVLRGAELRLPWPLDPAALRLRAPRWLSDVSARVEDGRLRLGGVALTGITATLSTDPYTGTYAAAGTGRFAGENWRFTARLTQPGSDGSAGLDVALDGQGRLLGAGGTLSGQIAPDGSFAGRLAARGPDLAELLPAPAVPFRAEGRVTAAGGLAAADDLALEIGGAQARAAVALRISPRTRLDLALATSRIDLDAWLPVLLRPTAAGLPTGIDLSAEAASLYGGTLRRLRVAIDLIPGGADIREAQALLPGDAALRLTGRVVQSPAGARFAGDGTLTAPGLRATLDWLRGAGLAPLAALPEGVLHRASLTAHLTANATQIALTKLAGDVDDSRLTGSVTLRAGKRFAIDAGLEVDRIALDAWLPEALPMPSALPARFAGFDLDLRLAARQAAWHGLRVAPLSFDAGVAGGRLVLRKLALHAGDVDADASASVDQDGRLADGRLDLRAPGAGALAALLPERFAALGRQAPELWQAPAAVHVLASGLPDALALKVAAELGDLRLEAQPVLNLRHGTWTSTLALRHPGAPRLLQSLGASNVSSWLGEGSFGLIAQMSGAPGTITADSFDLTAGSLHCTGALLLDHAGAVPVVNGHVELETLPLPLPAAHASDPLPLGWLAGWSGTVQLSAGRVLANLMPVLSGARANLSLSGAKLRIDHLTARVAGGTLDAAASVDAAAEPPAFAASFDLIGAGVSEPVFELPLDLLGGTLDAHATLAAHGHAPAALLATLGGDIRLDATSGTLGGVTLARAAALTEADARAALAGGNTPFDALALSARVDAGVLTLRDASLSLPAGRATLAGTYDLTEQTADLMLRFRAGTPDAPEIGLRLTGPAEQMRRTPDLAALTRWLGARAEAAP